MYHLVAQHPRYRYDYFAAFFLSPSLIIISFLLFLRSHVKLIELSCVSQANESIRLFEYVFEICSTKIRLPKPDGASRKTPAPAARSI